MFARSRDWTTRLPLRKTLSALHFQLCRLLKQYVLHCTRYWAGGWKRCKELGVFIDGKVQGYSFCPPKKYKPTKQAVWCTRNLHGIVWNSGRLDYSELAKFLPRAVKGEYFGKGTEKCKILGNLYDKEEESLKDHGCPKVRDLVVEKIWIRSSYPFRHKTTLHCGERKANLFGNWIMRHLML